MRTTSLLVAVSAAAVLAVVPATPARAATTCAAFGTITLGKYYLNNNLWGQSSGSGRIDVDSYTADIR